jgi:hypothetical protein
MNSTNVITQQQLQDEFGERVAARLSQGLPEVSHDISERLRTMRIQAVGRRRIVNVRAHTTHAQFSNGSTLVLGKGGSGGPGFWGWFASAVPLVALVGGLVLIHDVQRDARLKELAEVDSALLTDDLPPSAYTDPGFMQFLRSSNTDTGK